ncbi:MAG: DUF3299 domain-containing protein [Idiomarina sp.]
MPMHASFSANRITFFFLLLLLASPLVAAERNAQYLEVEWTDLMPADDLEALMNPPDYLSEILDGSQQDSVDAFGQQEFSDEKGQRFQQALTSTRVIREFENKAIRIPGFVVPLAYNQEREVTEFFIVPYFGACIHLPPPPPNQIIHAVVKQGLELENLYEPLWFEGVLAIEMTTNETAAAAYGLKVDNFFPYDD